MSEQMYLELRRMFQERNTFHSDMGHTEAAIAYASPAAMLEAAMTGDMETLSQYDYFHDEDADREDPEDWGSNEDEGFDPYMGEYTYDC